MSERQRNDNKEQERANFYKVLVAIKYALTKQDYNELIIEHKGDVTFDNKIQIEVKHIKTKLGNTGKDFWNTFYNWLVDNNNSDFEEFILHTTQQLTDKCIFKDFGKNYKTDAYRLKKLYKGEDFSSITKGSAKYYYNEIYNSGKFSDSFIESTVKRVKVSYGQKNDIELIKEIAKRFYKVSIPENQELFVRKYLGGTIYSEVAKNERWILTKEQFYKLSTDELRRFIEEPQRRFYNDYVDKEIEDAEIKSYYQKKFVKELECIDCEQHNIAEAITDYWRISSLIIEMQEFDYNFISREYRKYQKGRIYKKLRNTKDILRASSDENENRANSLEFYKKSKLISGITFESIPDLEYIHHGTMHRIVEDEDGEDYKFRWLIE